MVNHIDLTNTKLKSLIDEGAIKFGGNRSLKIYGTLSCKSGKRMKKVSRVFFKSEKEAIDKGYRPCGHCMREEYQSWKEKSNQSDLSLSRDS